MSTSCLYFTHKPFLITFHATFTQEWRLFSPPLFPPLYPFSRITIIVVPCPALLHSCSIYPSRLSPNLTCRLFRPSLLLCPPYSGFLWIIPSSQTSQTPKLSPKLNLKLSPVHPFKHMYLYNQSINPHISFLSTSYELIPIFSVINRYDVQFFV